MKRFGICFLLAALFLGSLASCKKDEVAPADLSVEGTANCYIVSEAGTYSFPAVIGNSLNSVGDVASVEVLWESFGTNNAPKAGELVHDLSYKDGKVLFKASGKKGNAVLAAKDKSGTILWSWHIWMTDAPEEQEYANNAGIMMDRNLGAISATPGDCGSYGLFYQWGRKDPFLGAGEDIEYTEGAQKAAASTLSWPEAVVSDAVKGTMEYAAAHPTTFIIEGELNRDWLYTGEKTVDKTRWQPAKTVNDPCPAGWMVPECGIDGIWGKALGTVTDWENPFIWDDNVYGLDFSKTDKVLGFAGSIWYPASGLRYGNNAKLSGVGEAGGWWSVSNSFSYYALVFCFYAGGVVLPSLDASRAFGCSVRCQKIQQ